MKKIVMIMMITIMLAVPATVNASWYSEAYTWANSEGIIAKKTDAQLAKSVEPAEFYTMLFRYLKLVDVAPRTEYDDYFKMDDYKADNYILVATDRQLTSYAMKEWLTATEHKKAAELIKNARNILERNPQYFEEAEKKSIEYYLDVMSYILYNKIYDYSYKKQVHVQQPKNGELFIEYKLLPYYGEITRKEFLNIIYYYTVAQGSTFSSGVTVGYYRYYDVLRGYNHNLMLTEKLTYAHFVTFISRM